MKRKIKEIKPKPAPGMMFLKDLPIGKMFETPCGIRGVLIDCDINAKVVILSAGVEEEDRQYYLGKQTIAAETEVYK